MRLFLVCSFLFLSACQDIIPEDRSPEIDACFEKAVLKRNTCIDVMSNLINDGYNFSISHLNYCNHLYNLEIDVCKKNYGL